MKRIKLFTFILMTAWIAGSCSLERFPETELSDENYWNSGQDLKQACNYLYTLLPGQDFSDNKTDLQYGQNPSSVSEGSWLIPSTSADWNDPYRMIFAANNIIEKSVKAETTEAVKNRYVAEARFFRAWAYFNLVSKYGDVPLLLKTLDINSPELSAPRTPREDVVSQIYADLDFGALNLPAFKALGTADYGRVSKSTALALKARVALFEGTRQKFHQYGQFAPHLTAAVAAAEAVMAEGHALYTAKGVDSYYYLFQYEGEGPANSEVIFAKVYGQNIANSILSHKLGRNLEQGYMSSTRSMIETYLCTDGLPMSISPLAVKPEVNSNSIFANKDPRLNASVFKTGDTWISNTYKPSISFAKTGYCVKKYFVIADWNGQDSYVDVHLMRYAEVLLAYAEAKFELNGQITDAELDKSINLLRARVSMPKLTNAFVTANGLNMRDEIRRERTVELAQEGSRYQDINRWKISETVLPQAILGAAYFASEYVNVKNPILTPEGLFVVQSKETRKFDPAKDYLYPVPLREISISGGAVTQNPNWLY
ncbi:MAG: RagB/SusD family nutrient uptake outer membrane protein [Prolixibacteraceae bacterium]|nr:RagB/SusD family nutrient uptake outer membrane protein [Prolixibacteraceae bacterium]